MHYMLVFTIAYLTLHVTTLSSAVCKQQTTFLTLVVHDPHQNIKFTVKFTNATNVVQLLI